MLPPVEFIDTTTCSFDSTDSSFYDLLNTSSHAYDFNISLKGFKSPVFVDLIVATWFHQFLIVNLLIQLMLVELDGTESLKSHNSNSQDFQEPLKCS